MAKNEKSKAMEKVKGKNIFLNKINGERLSISDLKVNGKVTLYAKSSFEVLENKEEKLQVKVMSQIGFDPDNIFKLNLELLVNFSLQEKADDDEIKEIMNSITPQLGNEVSYIVAFLTERMTKQPIIVPPLIDFEEE